MKKYLPAGVILFVAAMLYIPTLRTGFLTDDFLDSECTMSRVPEAFTSMASTGYRPLMSFSWAIDNILWGRENPSGWHFTNVVILFAALFVLYRFLSLYIESSLALFTGLLFFAICLPVAASVAKVVWRTSLLPVIPLLGAFILAHRWGSTNGRRLDLLLCFLLFLVSLFLKELALAAPPVFAVIVLTSDKRPGEWKKALIALLVTGAAVVLYLLVRCLVVGFATGYSDSLSIGFFMLKNVLTFSAITWTPWLFGIPTRILAPLFILFLWIVPGGWKPRLLIASMSVFMLLPVSNLAFRPDYAAAGVPAISLALGLLVQKTEKMKFALPVFVVLLTGIFLNSRDELRIIHDASDYVNRTTVRISEISDELPGSGPIFVKGIKNEIGNYGTFWPGEYMLPMECMGIEPERFVAGTDRLWESLTLENRPGFIVFVSEDGVSYLSSVVSPDMYRELPDTLVVLSGAVPAGRLTGYASCSGSSDAIVYIVSAVSPDTVWAVNPDTECGVSSYDLSAVPVWLAADENTVIMVENTAELVFSSRNLSLERAIRNNEQRPPVI